MKQIKRYENFVLLFLIFVLTTLVILRINCILDWLKVNDGSISIAEQFSGLILAYTAIIVFWYTIETNKLRKLSESNNYGLLEVDKNNTEINFAGLTAERIDSDQKFINISLFVTNIGRGGLEILEVKTTCKSHRTSSKSNKNPNFRIDDNFFVEHSTLSVRDTVRLTALLEIDKWYKDVVDFIVTIKYEDINGTYNQDIEFRDVNLDKGGHFKTRTRRKITLTSKS